MNYRNNFVVIYQSKTCLQDTVAISHIHILPQGVFVELLVFIFKIPLDLKNIPY